MSGAVRARGVRSAASASLVERLAGAGTKALAAIRSAMAACGKVGCKVEPGIK